MNSKLHLDKYKGPDGDYIYNATYYIDAESLLQCGVLQQCGCGNPEDNIRLVAKVLRHVHDRKMYVWDDNHKMTHEDWMEQGRKIGSDDVLKFIYYTIDEIELTEHGGSVPGWLTPLGIEFMEDVEALYGGN